MAVLGTIARWRANRPLEGDGSDSFKPGQRLPICPTCGGALAPRQRRCSSCGSRIVLGIVARKAIALTLMGALAGGAIGATVAVNLAGGAAAAGPGGGGVAAALVATVDPTPAPAQPAASAASGATGGAATQPSSQPAATRAPAAPAAPAQVVSALRQLVTLNDRLLDARSSLGGLLRSGASVGELAAEVRRIAADASSARALVQRLRGWKGSIRIGDDLGTYYTQLATAASTTASMTNESANRAIARDTLNALDRLTGLASRAKATLKTATAAP